MTMGVEVEFVYNVLSFVRHYSGVKQHLSGHHCIPFGPSFLQLAILGLHKKHIIPSLVHNSDHSLFFFFFCTLHVLCGRVYFN